MESKELGGVKLTRRELLLKGLLVGAGLLLPKRIKAETPQNWKEETERISPWEEKKRETIDSVFQRATSADKVYWKELIDTEIFAENGVEWHELHEGAELEVLNTRLKQKDIPTELKCTYRTLLNQAVKRYKEILKNPYSVIIDPDVNEVEAVINTVAKLTGLPPGMIKTFAWRENGLKGIIPQIHGDTYAPPIGGGFINFEAYESSFGKDLSLKKTGKHSEHHIVIRAPGEEDGYLLPITNTAARYDALLGTLIPMAIALEHVEKVFGCDQENPQVAQLRDFLLDFRNPNLEIANSAEDKLTKFVGLAYTLYHHGIYRPKDGIIDQPLDFARIANERFTKFDFKNASLPELQNEFASFFQAIGTFGKYKPWRKERYKMEGKGAAKDHEFYCQVPNFIRKHVDENPQLWKAISIARKEEWEQKYFSSYSFSFEDAHTVVEILVTNPNLFRRVMEFNFIEFFRKNFEALCDSEIYTPELRKKVDDLIISSGFEYETIQKTKNPKIRSQLQKLELLLQIGKKFTEGDYGYDECEFLYDFPLWDFAYYYMTWSDRSWPEGELRKILYQADETLKEKFDLDSLVPENLKIPGEEKSALLKFWKTTSGQSWKRKWDLGLSPDLWEGVTVENGHVTGINLFYNNLRGLIPPELSKLPFLDSLILVSNQLEGPIPPELGKLPRLHSLYLSDNQLTGVIPHELGELSKLLQLNLSDNQLTGEIPPELGKLECLCVLYLENNQLTGEIPPELRNLKSLEHLYISSNELGGKIPNLSGLLGLTYIDLASNNFEGKIPSWLTNLPCLYGFSLTDNHFEEMPDKIGKFEGKDGVYQFTAGEKRQALSP